MDTLEFLSILQALHAPRRGRAPTPPEYLTPHQLCERWHAAVAMGTMANWRAQKRGPGFVRFGGRVLYPFAAVVAWERAQLASVAAPQKGGRRG